MFREEVRVEEIFIEREEKGEEECESEFKDVEKIGEREWKGILREVLSVVCFLRVRFL